MNQPTPPPDDTNPDAKPDAETAARWEEPKPDDEPRMRSEPPKLDDDARLRSEQPNPNDDAGLRSEEPNSNDGSTGARWEEPQPNGGGAYSDANAPRRRHPIEENITRKSTWARLVFIVLFAIAWWIAEFVLTAVVVIQFLVVLFTGEPNERLRAFGQSLSRYAYQLFRYLTFNSDARPFPLDLDWPSGERDSASS